MSKRTICMTVQTTDKDMIVGQSTKANPSEAYRFYAMPLNNRDTIWARSRIMARFHARILAKESGGRVLEK